jgi:pyruvate/2-oxoglutarate/acetoin dehydrogenase E1 component
MWSPWIADFEWVDGLLDKYPDVWIKNNWLSEDGSAGIWIGALRDGKKEIKRLDWQDMSLEEEMCVFSNW